MLCYSVHPNHRPSESITRKRTNAYLAYGLCHNWPSSEISPVVHVVKRY